MENDIPLLDFSSLNIGENLDETNPEINKLAQELYDAFTTAGFVYIKNPRISGIYLLETACRILAMIFRTIMVVVQAL